MIPHAKDAMMRQHIVSWQLSAHSQVEYCKQHNIPSHIFSYYKKKLGHGFSESPANINQLIPVNIISEPKIVEHIKITHANGFSLQVNPENDVAHLKPLLELLSSVV